jgi:hypothetical protein
MGTTTATAMVPPLLRPLLVAFTPVCDAAVDADDDDDEVPEPVFVVPGSRPAVDVTTVVIVDPPAVVWVITDVKTELDDDIVGVVEVGMIEVVPGVMLPDVEVGRTLELVGRIEVVGGKIIEEEVGREVVGSIIMPDKRLVLASELGGNDDEGTEA